MFCGLKFGLCYLAVGANKKHQSQKMKSCDWMSYKNLLPADLTPLMSSSKDQQVVVKRLCLFTKPSKNCDDCEVAAQTFPYC